jgi:hypothetical protein
MAETLGQKDELSFHADGFFCWLLLQPIWATLRPIGPMKTKLVSILCAVALLTMATSTCRASSRDPGLVVADAVIVRPLCLVATIVGSAFFVVSLPVAATSGSIHRAADALVVGPARATFTRPLGDIDELMDY